MVLSLVILNTILTFLSIWYKAKLLKFVIILISLTVVYLILKRKEK